MKYIVINGLQPILFGDLINHDSLLNLLKTGDEITSAGFVKIEIGSPVCEIPELNINCYGYSTRLKLGCSNEDSELIKKLISSLT